MVLSVKRVFDIRNLKRVAPGEVDPFDPLSHRSQDVYRVLVQLAVIRAPREIGPDLEAVRSPSGEGSKGVDRGPTIPRRIPGLIGEVVPAIAHGSDGQILVAFRPDPDIETHGGKRALEQPSE